MADEVPSGPSPDDGECGRGFLDIILADDRDARVDGLEDLGRGLGLGRGDELDAGRQLGEDRVRRCP